jgi:hypothetical protein
MGADSPPERGLTLVAPPGQIPGAKISVCQGVGGIFAASGTVIMSNEPP